MKIEKKKIKLKAFLNFKKMKIEPRFLFFIFQHSEKMNDPNIHELSESLSGLILNLKFANITFLTFANNAAWRNLDTSHQHNNSFSFTRRYIK